MTHDDMEANTSRFTERAGVPPAAERERSIPELFKQLTTDTGELIHGELTLAKAELRETGATLARDGMKVGIAAGVALGGYLALVAFLIAGLGRLLGGLYWLSALIVAVVFLAIGGVLTAQAMRDLKRRPIIPTQTVNTVRDDALWAKQEVREVKRELTQR